MLISIKYSELNRKEISNTENKIFLYAKKESATFPFYVNDNTKSISSWKHIQYVVSSSFFQYKYKLYQPTISSNKSSLNLNFNKKYNSNDVEIWHTCITWLESAFASSTAQHNIHQPETVLCWNYSILQVQMLLGNNSFAFESDKRWQCRHSCLQLVEQVIHSQELPLITLIIRKWGEGFVRLFFSIDKISNLIY